MLSVDLERISDLADPILSANIYATGLLDDVMQRALLPFWQDASGSACDGRFLLWTVRYSRNGEHLKVRIHADDHACAALKETFLMHVQKYLDEIIGLPPPASQNSRTDVPAIDVEDQTLTPAIDRSLMWTTYQRSPVSLAGAPWLDDDSFAALSCTCMSKGCELVLEAMKNNSLGSTGNKQKLLIKSLLAGLAASGSPTIRQTATYLKYHRDWLLRFFIEDEGKQQQMLTTFMNQVNLAQQFVSLLQQLASQYLGTENKGAVSRTGWGSAVADLSSFVEQFQESSEHRIDPFASSVSFPPLFKIFHGMANQMGLLPMQEAYAHHLLLAAIAPEEVASSTQTDPA